MLTVQYMKDIGRMTKLTVEEELSNSMVTSMRAILKKIRLKDVVPTLILMAKNTLETGRMTSSTDMEKKSGLTVQLSVVIMRMEESTDMVNSNGQMVLPMLAISSMVPSVARVLTPGQMEDNMRASGSKERCTVLAK